VNEESVHRLCEIEAPFGRKIMLLDVLHESGLNMLRVRIREGQRFTILDIDRDTALRLGEEMRAWVESDPDRDQ
jgi:hypothetical protein